MDDIKLYAGTKPNLNQLLKIVEIFSKDIKMAFGIDKCKTQNITKGKYNTGETFSTSTGQQINPLLKEEHYKYLGIRQNITIDHTTHKVKIKQELSNRLQKICKTALNGKNLIKAINTYSIPLLTYTFGIISWTPTDLTDLDRTVRKTLTRYKQHHPKSCLERLYIPRKMGGRGLLNIQNLHDKQINSLTNYFTTKATTSALYNAIARSDDNLTPLNLKNYTERPTDSIQSLLQKWKSKPQHGKYPNHIYKTYVDSENTANWLKYSNIYAETEGFIMAIQDGVIQTRNYRKYIMHDNTIPNDQCRRCGAASETIAHLLNSCTTLTHNHYTTGHNNI